MLKSLKLDIITQQIQAFLRLMFHDLRQVRAILRPELRREMSFLRFLMLGVAILETLTIFVITLFGTSISAPQVIKGSSFFRLVFEAFPGFDHWCVDDRNFLFFMSLFMIFFIVIKNISSAACYWKSSSFSEKVSQEIGSEIMRRYLYSPYLWHLSNQSRATFQAMGWRSYLTTMVHSLLNMQSYTITTLFLFLGLMCVAPGLTLIVYLFTGGVGFLTYKLIRLSADRAGNNSATAYARENTAVSNAVQGIREILIYRQQPVFLGAFSDAARSGNNPRAYLNISSTIPSWVMEVCGFLIISATIVMLTHFWHMDMAQITKIVILLMLTSWRALPSLNKVVNLVVVVRGVRPLSLPCLEMVKALRAHNMELPPPPDPDFVFDREIRLENVSFRYPDSKDACLMNISLTIPKGELIGFIGSSGGGKSTMIAILSGLLEPTSGEIKVDGKRLSPGGRAAYCLKVGYVPQNPFFMAGSLAENIAFSEWGKPWDEQRVRSACQRAAIDFINPERGGLEMPLGEKAGNISGGQAQRVAIARALYVNPDIVIFDEATSSLDQANEKIIHETVMSLRKNTTCIIVSHRLTTIEACSHLFWIEQGSIIAEGAPSEILPFYVETMKNKGEPVTDIAQVQS